MALLKQKNKNLVGIDFGSATIKIVQLQKNDHQYQLVTYSLGKKPHTSAKFESEKNQKEIVSLLHEMLRQARVTTDQAVAALPPASVFNTVIEMPKMSAKEMTQAIHWEAKKLIPLPIEKMKLTWQTIPDKLQPKDAKTTQIILTAASNDVINSYMSIFHQTDLQLVGLETEVSALKRSLLPQAPGSYLLLDIGTTSSSATAFFNGLPLITRNINIGSVTIDNQIASTMNITADRAEQFRLDVGIAASQANHPAAKAITFVLDNMIVQEIKRLIASFEQKNNQKIKQVILTGGCAQMKNLSAYMQQKLSIDVAMSDPWQYISYPLDLKEALTKIGPQVAVAVGLAMKK